ncbi:hypothetical protein FRC07_007685 [Ceratobasidium sp. 392]|nr:hypothetical protein FRC07_007685 [Ceratobasidium sp. 392]
MPVKNVVENLIKHSSITDLTDKVKKGKIDGEGPFAFGGLADVYRATLADKSVVAIKSIRQVTDEKHVKHTARELSTWARLKHQSILELSGLAMFRGCLAMVSPWMEHGNVNHAIRNNPNLDRYQLCRQLAAVIKYLHIDENVVHGDIKGENLLMAADGTLKLTDFGLAIMHDKVLQFSQTDPGGGTACWMAPELFNDGAQRCYEADVYAMGMTMLEMITGKPPFHEIQNSGPAIIRAVFVEKRTPDVLELERKPISPRSYIMIGILHRCWRYHPKERATVDEVVALLDLAGDV